MDPPHGPPPMELAKWQVESANARGSAGARWALPPPSQNAGYIVITGNDAQEAVKEAVSAVRRVCRVDCGLAFAPARAARPARGPRGRGVAMGVVLSQSHTDPRPVRFEGLPGLRPRRVSGPIR